ncbi:MAG: FG-GAP repeat domain-containing protein [Gammaproteobacteria bacterium]
MRVLLGIGSGTFPPKVDYAIGAKPYSVAVADLNLDGKPDLVTSNFFGDNTVSALLNATP